ncbi:MAG TPA: heparinase II/III family protein [Candidatus Kapabacteria bacterium]|nr:heparinase II/III family protein [Candidatus Kapabacteria bacterium]
MSALRNLTLAIQKLGLKGTVTLLAEKQAKKRRLEKLLGKNPGSAILKLVPAKDINVSDEERASIIERADEMLRNENYIFTFLHSLRTVHDPWNYDPVEEKHWPKRRYEETAVHSEDTPKDVKIVWEVNRFKYLPTLAQAAYLTKEKKYVNEIEWRLLSWIEGNPIAGSVNWSSPLEIGIRGISWAATLRILAFAGYDLYKNEAIARSVWQHAAYLDAELSIDKIVRSNHLVGETAGLFILASLFDFPENEFYRLRAKKVLEDSILKQTYDDGASRESSGWYHTFVTDFADLYLRTTNHDARTTITDRFKKMELYRNSIIATDGEVVKYGDCDFGKVINLSPQWKDTVFGVNLFPVTDRADQFKTAEHITAKFDKNYLFVRAGDFGWGGDGFSSHAHDDFLSPIIYLDGLPIIVDSGTYVYNGNRPERDKYRSAEYHNGVIITMPKIQAPVLKPNFGWLRTRPKSVIESFQKTADKITISASYGEWRGKHKRWFTLGEDECLVEDIINMNAPTFQGGVGVVDLVEWNFHFHPRWRLERVSAQQFTLHDYRNNRYSFELSKADAELELLPYEFSPSYGRKSAAHKLHLSMKPEGEFAVSFILKKNPPSF